MSGEEILREDGRGRCVLGAGCAGLPGSRVGSARGGDLPVSRGPCRGVVLGVAPGSGAAVAAEEGQPDDVSHQTVGVRVVEVSGRVVSAAERSSSPRLRVTPSKISHNLQEQNNNVEFQRKTIQLKPWFYCKYSLTLDDEYV